MILSLYKPENFKAISKIADEHTLRGPRGSSNYHFVGSVLHDAAAKLGGASGLSWDHPLVQHHANQAVVHQKQDNGSYGNPNEGPHAHRGGLLGVPASYSSGK
jgi:hypothetical protein